MAKMRKGLFSHIAAWIMAIVLLFTNCYLGSFTTTQVKAATSSSYQKIEFEDANHFSSDSGNRTDNQMFSGYSGNGYVYLVSGWAEVNFTIATAGDYKITLATNSDQYKENWMYLDNNSAGTLKTEGNQWGTTTYECYLSAGTHKFGVSSNWGYVALDYAIIELKGGQISTAPATSAAPVTGSEDGVYEFEDTNKFSSDSGNKVANDEFSGYSGSGYVYLVSGWAEVNFSVPTAGKYKITIATTSDQYKENWLYLDDSSAGDLKTESGKWTTVSNTYTLAAGTHKFGVSSNWGYVALDYVKVELAGSPVTVKPTVKPSQSTVPTSTPSPSQSIKPTSTTGGRDSDGNPMYVRGTKLYDGNGNEFVMRGINIPHAWYTDKTETSIKAAARLGANCVRVVLADGDQWTKTSESEVKNIIRMCRENKLICVLEVHDTTGIDNTASLQKCVDYWKEIKGTLNANADYVIVNIANEWMGTWNNHDTFKNTYISAIQQLRNSGLKNVIMVDAAGYGQETDSLFKNENCKALLQADSTGNTMFSIHMYACAGKDSSTVKNNINTALNMGICLCIGEFGHVHGGEEVDEDTIMSYSDEKRVGYLAWSWKGNGSYDAPLDMSNDWEGNDLLWWGQKVFAKIQESSYLAYYLTGYHGGVIDVSPSPSATVAPTASASIAPLPTGEIPIDAGELDSFTTDWYVSSEGDDSVSDVSELSQLSNNGLRVAFNLSEEEYPYLCNMVSGVDLSSYDTISIVVRNNSASAFQIQPIFKVGPTWKWTEYAQYQTVPAVTTTMLSFDMSSCTARNEVNSIMFRIQGAGSKFVGTADFISMGYDLPETAYTSEIAELNRPKTASYFTWKFQETSWEANTKSATCDSEGNLNISFVDVSSDVAGGIQTETKPGLGKGMDFSGYDTISCTITNNSTEEIHVSLVLRTSGGWTWQENGGMVNGEDGETVIGAGESVDVTYYLKGSTWKSKANNWQYTGELEDADDVRAIGFKIYAGAGESVTGSVVISDFQCNF